MAQGLITHATLEDIADAIREKLNTQDTYTPAQMAAAVMRIPTSSVEIVPWSSGTDEQIVAMLEAAHMGDIDLQVDGGWVVGDTRTIQVSAFSGTGFSEAAQEANIVISSFDDYNNCGCVMQFDFAGLLSTSAKWNSGSNINGGYGASKMCTVTLPNLVNALPSWLKDLLITFDVKVASVNSSGKGSTTIETVSNNKLALRSEVEVQGRTVYTAAGEGSQTPYYATANNRKKKKGSYSESWFTRSPKYNNNTAMATDTDGTAVSMSAGNGRGLSPFGCL